MPELTNIFAAIPPSVDQQEFFEQILQSGPVRIERIISKGQVSPEGYWYDQPENEWVIVLQGAARLSFQDGSEVQLKRGDYQLLLAHQKHRVTFTSTEPPCIWLAVYFPMI